MTSHFKRITQGTITSPKGFLAGATYIGLKSRASEALDLGVLFSEAPCAAAGVFTTSKVKAAPVVLCRRRLERNAAQAVVVNSGCANACTGEQGHADAEEMAALTAKRLGLSPDDVLVASTGIIGAALPMHLVRSGIEKISLSGDGGHKLARAIMTTDRVPKETAVQLVGKKGDGEVTIGGIAKGAGMIHPNLATQLCFLATDAAVEPTYLTKALKKAADISFNMITVDGDTSPNDSVIILANGLAGNRAIADGTPEAEGFETALMEVCVFLAKSLVRDAEGATRLIEVVVDGALSPAEARAAARTVAGSPLVKTAVYGSDPNWGRIIAALGRSGIEMASSKTDLYISNVCLVREGVAVPFDRHHVKSLLGSPEVSIRACLNLGDASATAWGCDLTEEYVRINSEYTT